MQATETMTYYIKLLDVNSHIIQLYEIMIDTVVRLYRCREMISCVSEIEVSSNVQIQLHVIDILVKSIRLIIDG